MEAAILIVPDRDDPGRPRGAGRAARPCRGGHPLSGAGSGPGSSPGDRPFGGAGVGQRPGMVGGRVEVSRRVARLTVSSMITQ